MGTDISGPQSQTAKFVVPKAGINGFDAGSDILLDAQTMENESLWYLDTLEELLGEVAQSDDAMSLLLSETGGAAWHVPEIEDRLRARLNRSYDSYFRTMAIMVEALEMLGEKLGVDIRGTVRP